MSTFSQERTFTTAVAQAEATRQTALSAAFTAYANNSANLATYLTAVAAAQNAYAVSVASAANTAQIDPEIGMHGPIPIAWGKLSGN